VQPYSTQIDLSPRVYNLRRGAAKEGDSDKSGGVRGAGCCGRAAGAEEKKDELGRMRMKGWRRWSRGCSRSSRREEG